MHKKSKDRANYHCEDLSHEVSWGDDDDVDVDVDVDVVDDVDDDGHHHLHLDHHQDLGHGTGWGATIEEWTCYEMKQAYCSVMMLIMMMMMMIYI